MFTRAFEMKPFNMAKSKENLNTNNSKKTTERRQLQLTVTNPNTHHFWSRQILLFTSIT